MLTQNLGYPRIGAKRELKKACENYWAGKISQQELLHAGKLEREKNWKVQHDAGIDIIPCNDFSFYDHMQDMSLTVGAIPERFSPLKNTLSETDLYFAMCRGYQNDTHDVVAMEMTKWFDTNYHYIVPEFSKNQTFSFNNKKVIHEFIEAKSFGIQEPKPVLIGPITYLLLGKEKESGFDRLELINKLLPVYIDILKDLVQKGCNYIQLDEPFLVTELSQNVKTAYNHVYDTIKKEVPNIKVVLATYFDGLGDNVELAVNLPIYALHIDLVKNPEQLETVLKAAPQNLVLSLGVVDGRNIWKNDYNASNTCINTAVKTLKKENIWIAPSCSLLHSPYDLDFETNEKSLPAEVKNWMAFSKQKLTEIQFLKKINTASKNKSDSDFPELIENEHLHIERKHSNLVNNKLVQNKVHALIGSEIKRNADFKERIEKQSNIFKFEAFPTTTIGSFPQTSDVRKKRRAAKKGAISETEYHEFIKSEITQAVKWQEEIGLDVLVHGEFERNDMVEYFGELLNGFAFTENGWVQSYGSRGVKPPVIYGDVSRKEPMTIFWSKYAQSLTSKKMKGMLTGPVTILKWSFVRTDQPLKTTAFQIANALHEEVLDLEQAGIDIIQIDEPALREGLPLKHKEWTNYLDWAVKAFRICSWGVKDETQIHTHMCYCEFNDIMDSIAAMDADVISIETSRSQMELLNVFKEFKYPNHIGPGVYDIHSPRIPSKEEMENLIKEAMHYVPAQNLWINPDCGLKTRKWDEVKPALENMVKAAEILRKQVVTNA